MLSLNRIISNGCVIQRDTENEIRGTSGAGASVSLAVRRNGAEVFSADTAAGADGLWSVTIPPFSGSTEAYSLVVTSGGENVEVNEVYFGELFHISGQSNMELPLSRTYDPFKDEPMPKENPLIREFRVPVTCRFSKTAQAEDFAGGEWKSAVGSALHDMSAAGYYFAADIYERLGIPVGLVNTSAGGAAVESFMPYDMIRGYGIHDSFLEEATKDSYIEETTAADMAREKAWYEALGADDHGLKPSDSMESCVVPCTVDDIDELNGFSGRVFFFREVDVPEDFPKENAKLILGTITDSDAAFVNGTLVGETAYMYPPRYYDIGAGILHTGKNVIAVRVEIRNGRGGFTKGKRCCIKAGVREIELSGEWKYAVTAKSEPLQPSVFFQGLPLALYADMMFPALKTKFKALVWYQGESNCGRAGLYTQMFGDFIRFYRRECGYDIPVIFTQLCNYEGMSGCNEGGDSWAELRNAQLGCLDISGTAMAVTLDLGEYNDLHPKNKRGVGKRLARRAFGLLYGDDVPFLRCVAASRKADCIELCFSGGVYLQNSAFSMFEAVCGGKVSRCDIVSSEGCSDRILLKCGDDISGGPILIRYAYTNAPRILNLFAPDLSPLSPFVITVGS